MASLGRLLASRHIQNESEADYLEPHWGYADRVRPCTNDAGSCAYLDQVYQSHDLSMMYSGILWGTILAVLFVWTVGRRLWAPSRTDGLVPGSISTNDSSVTRFTKSFSAYMRSSLLPDAARPIFGRTTRFQVLILAILAGYLLIWSFVGITYQTWITPVKKMPGLFNTRTSLGPFSDRIGILAYALTPLSILLSNRESVLSLLTGVPYQSFNFLHRWLGYIIFIQSSVHTIAWTVVEVRLYQPQPTTAIEWVTQPYIIWGVVAMILLLMIVVLSTPWGIRLTGYEFFRKAHYVLAMIYIGACWGHWDKLKCFLLPSLLIWGLDRGVRFLRTALIHYQYLPDGSMGFRAAPASLTHFSDVDGDVVRMDFNQPHDAWKVGQHFYLCFPESSVWQSHPFTPLNLPQTQNGSVKHSYIFRAKKGETKKIANLALKKLTQAPSATTSVVLTGPYGDSIAENLMPEDNVLCVAGGTGITYVLPVLLGLIHRNPGAKDRRIQLIWAIRRKADLCWVEEEMVAINNAARSHGVDVHIYVTREASSSSTSSLQDDKAGGVINVKETCGLPSCSSTSVNGVQTPMSLDIQKIGSKGLEQHPDLKTIVTDFVEGTVRGPTKVFGSGPGGMISELRSIVAASNSGAKVWRGDERSDVTLICDDRLEW